MRVAHKAAIAGRIVLPSSERADLTMKLANGGAHQRHFGGKAQIINDKTRGEIIAAVDDQIDASKNVC